MNITVDDDALRAAGLSDDEMRLEVAVLLFSKGLTAARASRVAERPLYDFMQELSRRRISPHYDVDDLNLDLEASEVDLAEGRTLAHAKAKRDLLARLAP